MKEYQVFGGQYGSHWYGESDTLRGAKLIAQKHKEYWDNWQGWHTPSIYRSSKVREVVSYGRITTDDGTMIRIPVGCPDYEYILRRSGWGWVEN